MCCPLILYREETISRAKGLDIMKKREEEGERRSVNLEDHEQVKERGESSETNPQKKERTTRSIYSSSQCAPVIKVTS
jgi:hypothetical protein